MELSIEQQLASYTDDRCVLVCAGAGAGKCQPDDTIIPTPNGYSRLDSLKMGDKVYNRFGEEEEIVGIFPQGEKEVYKVTLADGRETFCCEEHLWSYDNSHGGLTTNTLKRIIELGYRKKDKRGHNSYKFRIPNLLAPIPYKEKEYDIHPYVIGCFIGDGCCTEPYLTFSSNDEEIVKYISELTGFKYNKRSINNYSWDFFFNGSRIKTQNFFKNYNNEICTYCGEKRIPYIYKIGSVEQRLELLRGLMDTDGYVGDGRHSPTYSTTSYLLAHDVMEICRSLGFHCSLHKYDRKDKKSIEYEVIIFTGSSNVYNIFKLSRKKEKALTFNNNTRLNHKFESIVNIEKMNYTKPMRCILVNHPEHLYVTNDFIVTHNTRCLTERVRYLLEEKKIDPSTLFCITYTNMAADEMKLRLGDLVDKCFIGTIHSLANRILLQSGISTAAAIEEENFDKFFSMLQLNKENLVLPNVQHLLVDEIQDICDKEYNFMRTILQPKNFWAVGDSRQCQPAGTKIRLRNNIYKNIEDIQVGDSVCWYSPQDAFACGATTKAWNAKEKKVTKISSREFINDNLITITTENGLSSSYTPNHITFVKMNKTEYLHAVYLMCDENNRFRIGKIPMYCTNKSRTNPWRDKMYKEGCDRIWILDVFKTDLEARVLETKLSYKYQIPQTCWQLDKVRWTKENIDYIYEGLDTLSSAKKCLKEFNRDYNYPLLNKNDESIRKVHFAHNAVAEIYACNLMPKLMSCLVYDEYQSHKHYRYEKIVDVNFNYITEPIKVYSLKVEDETYVADEIITHNSIYAFKGANYEIFMGLTEDPFVTVFELRDCYRCGPEVIDFANYHIRKVNNIYRTPTKCIKSYGGSTVEEDEFSYAAVLATVNEINDYKNTTILCRSNAMVDDMLFFLKRNGIPAFTFKKGDKTYIELQEELKSNAVKVLTVHSAKGLEWDNVIVCQEVQPWNDEECRINYVAATRAKNYLLWLRPARKRGYGKNQKASFKQQYVESQMQEW